MEGIRKEKFSYQSRVAMLRSGLKNLLSQYKVCCVVCKGVCYSGFQVVAPGTALECCMGCFWPMKDQSWLLALVDDNLYSSIISWLSCYFYSVNQVQPKRVSFKLKKKFVRLFEISWSPSWDYSWQRCIRAELSSLNTLEFSVSDWWVFSYFDTCGLFCRC